MRFGFLLNKLPRVLIYLFLVAMAGISRAGQLERLKYNYPGLVVDLGVGLWAWPLPMDFDGDGDLDLVVNCPDKPYNGVYFFENASGDTATNKMPVFKAARRISKGLQNVQVSYVNGKPRLLSPGMEYPDFLRTGLEHGEKLPLPANVHPNRVRGNFWRYVDFDGDGRLDVIVGTDDWTDYGWDNAYDSTGRWTNGPLRGFVYFIRSTGTTEKPVYDEPLKIMAGSRWRHSAGRPPISRTLTAMVTLICFVVSFLMVSLISKISGRAPPRSMRRAKGSTPLTVRRWRWISK